LDPFAKDSGNIPRVAVFFAKLNMARGIRAIFFSLALLCFVAGSGGICHAQENLALELHGGGDFVELPRGVLSNLTTATIEMWVKWSTFNEPVKRAFNYGGPHNDISLVARNNGELWFVFPESRTNYHDVATRAIIARDQWYHVACALGPQGMKLYLNGWELGSNPFTGGFDKAATNGLFRLGETVTTADPRTAFAGAIDEVRIWSTNRSPATIRAEMHRQLKGAEPGLVALWNFDDGTARDRGTNGWHGELRGKAASAATVIPESIGAQEMFVDARVRTHEKKESESVILEMFAGTNLLTARYSKDGIFKLILPSTDQVITMKA
jgi:hypothetical protein